MMLIAVLGFSVSVTTIVTYFLGPHDGDERGPRFADAENILFPLLSALASLLALVFGVARPDYVQVGGGAALSTIILATLFVGELWLFFAEQPLRRVYVDLGGARRVEWNYRKIRYGLFTAATAWYAVYLLFLR